MQTLCLGQIDSQQTALSETEKGEYSAWTAGTPAEVAVLMDLLDPSQPDVSLTNKCLEEPAIRTNKTASIVDAGRPNIFFNSRYKTDWLHPSNQMYDLMSY